MDQKICKYCKHWWLAMKHEKSDFLEGLCRASTTHYNQMDSFSMWIENDMMLTGENFGCVKFEKNQDCE